MESRGGPTLTGTIFNVQRSSFHDGPGVRTTVFLKGCPLRCSWCHNPEGIARVAEVMVNSARCLRCNACVEACPRPQGPLAAGAVLGNSGCLNCGACFEACPSAARERAGRSWTVEEVVQEVLRDRLAYDVSGGGVTFSGGEPLLQPEFLAACLETCRRQGVHTAVDTCGYAERGIVLDIADRTDLLLWDVKHLDPARHREITGVPLEPILANLAAVATVGVPVWLRMPVMAGINDDADSLAALSRIASTLPVVEKVSLLPYHRTGDGKLERLGREPATAVAAAPSPERLAAMAQALAGAGVPATIGG